ncbi:ABC transporter substrate-binding protein [Hyphococcus flavus]|uniref:ABC transporter substrate-binding protein n=1 Tax=Hyphococcus flavus TaxID=1866326 RepID=A0AAE9ZED9_9PROT|nr:ABC transporter substrate-binding protein [Hyphococcus flavus]WDI31233.1 ABC transporter substrate-binding protein [Hyphococcus flavus]
MRFASEVTRRILTGLFALAISVFSVSMSALAAGAINVGVQLEPPNLDPTSGAAAAIDEIVYVNVFEGLTRINEDGSVSPHLATDWTISGNGLVYEFMLRENVTFHDGTAFDANDVVFSLNRAKAPSSTNAQRPIFEQVDKVEAIATNAVRITLKEPLGALPVYLGWGDAVIVAPESAANNASNPIGTGPYKFQRWRKGASVTLNRNANYWGAHTPLDQINFIFIPDPTAAFASLMAGDVDGFPNYPAAENLGLIERDDRFKIITGTGEGEMILAINNGKAPFNDIRVRRALTYAIDKQAVIDAGLFGYGTPIGSHFPPHHPSYIDLSGRYLYDPDEAKRLLREAGFSNGLNVTLTLPPPAYARRGGEVIAAQLEAVGLNVTIRNMEWAQWLDQVFSNKNYDLTIVSHTEPLDIDIYARDNYYFQYKNDDFNSTITKLRGAANKAQRDALFKKAQQILADDAVNVFIASTPKIAVWSKNVEHVWANAPLQANDLTKADVIGRPPLTTQNSTKASLPLWPLFVFAVTTFVIVAVYARASPAFLAARIFSMIGTLFLASLFIFLLIEVAPGDPASFMMGLNADPAALAALKSELGLDKPLPIRYVSWIGGIITGDFGISYTYRIPVTELLAERIWVSLPLALFAFAISTVIGLPAGLFAASLRKKLSGKAIFGAAQAGVAIPNFWLAILLVLFFAVTLQWFSAGGFPGWDAGFLPAMKALLLPAIALALPQAAILTQIMRSATIETLREDYIRTARAKGLNNETVLRKHAMRNAMIPVLTILGLQFSFLLAGSVIIENVFYLPGIGRLVFQSIAQRDLIVVESIVLVLVFSVVIVAFLIDLAYAIVDPRLRRQGARS